MAESYVQRWAREQAEGSVAEQKKVVKQNDEQNAGSEGQKTTEKKRRKKTGKQERVCDC